MSGSDTVWFDGHVNDSTPACWLVEVDGEVALIPMSQVRADSDTPEHGEDVTLGIPRWLAEDKDIDYREER